MQCFTVSNIYLRYFSPSRFVVNYNTAKTWTDFTVKKLQEINMDITKVKKTVCMQILISTCKNSRPHAKTIVSRTKWLLACKKLLSTCKKNLSAGKNGCLTMQKNLSQYKNLFGHN